MKWFKHLSGSLKNSFISDLVYNFGGDGYLVFFGVLELMSDEFDFNNPGVLTISWNNLRRNLQLSRQKTAKILSFCHQKANENHSKNVSFFVEMNDSGVVINCVRFKELCDEYTRKEISKKSGVCQDTLPQKVFPEEEVEGEEEKELEVLAPNRIPKREKITDEVYIIKLKETFHWIDVDLELQKMDLWLLNKPNRKKTRRFILNWLSKIDKPIDKNFSGGGKYEGIFRKQ